MSKPEKPIDSCGIIPLVLFFVLLAAPAYLVGWHGIDRPYFAIPDQDLLWLSEGMRLVRGVAPSYADHPGAIWSLISFLNLEILLRHVGTGSIGVLEMNQLLPSAVAEKGVFLMRIQNAFVVAALPVLFYTLARQYRVRRSLTLISAFVLSSSTALLVAVSEIRHEVMSIFFFSLFLLATNSLIKGCLRGDLLWKRLMLVALVFASFFLLCFSKQQALCLFPFAVLSAGWVYWIDRGDRACLSGESSFAGSLFSVPLSRKLFSTLIAGSSIVWVLSALPDIDLINLPFWIFINAFLVSLVFVSIVDFFPAQRAVGVSLLSVLIAQLFVFRVLSPGWWRQAVTGFPSWMFQYANDADDKISHSFSGFKNYLGDFFLNQDFGFWLVVLLSIASLLSLFMQFQKIRMCTEVTSCSESAQALGRGVLVDAAWLFSVLLAIAFTQRFAVRYEIYFYAPFLMLAAMRAEFSFEQLQGSGFASKSFRDAFLGLGCTIFLALLLFKSTSNLSRLSEFVNSGQPAEFLCFGHHMDRSMESTVAGACPNFDEAKKSKDSYDSWWGPN